MASVVLCARWHAGEGLTTALARVFALSQLGILLAGAPFAWAAGLLGWRGAYMASAALTLGLTALWWAWVQDDPPDRPRPHRPAETLGGALRGQFTVWRTPGLLPVLAMHLVGYAVMATVLAVWAGPYLSEVHGLAPGPRGAVLFAMGLALVLGLLGVGPLERRLNTRKWLVAGMASGAVLVLVLLAAWPRPPLPVAAGLLVLLCLLSCYPVVVVAHGRSLFPDHLVGRGATTVNLAQTLGSAALPALTGWAVAFAPGRGGLADRLRHPGGGAGARPGGLPDGRGRAAAPPGGPMTGRRQRASAQRFHQPRRFGAASSSASMIWAGSPGPDRLAGSATGSAATGLRRPGLPPRVPPASATGASTVGAGAGAGSAASSGSGLGTTATSAGASTAASTGTASTGASAAAASAATSGGRRLGYRHGRCGRAGSAGSGRLGGGLRRFHRGHDVVDMAGEGVGRRRADVAARRRRGRLGGARRRPRQPRPGAGAAATAAATPAAARGLALGLAARFALGLAGLRPPLRRRLRHRRRPAWPSASAASASASSSPRTRPRRRGSPVSGRPPVGAAAGGGDCGGRPRRRLLPPGGALASGGRSGLGLGFGLLLVFGLRLGLRRVVHAQRGRHGVGGVMAGLGGAHAARSAAPAAAACRPARTSRPCRSAPRSAPGDRACGSAGRARSVPPHAPRSRRSGASRLPPRWRAARPARCSRRCGSGRGPGNAGR